MRARLDDQQGFTMVEIVVTIVILVVGLSSLMGLFPVGLKASERGATLSMVAMLASNTTVFAHTMAGSGTRCQSDPVRRITYADVNPAISMTTVATIASNNNSLARERASAVRARSLLRTAGL